MNVKIIIRISDKNLIGSKLPKWYGFAYREFDIRYTTLAIIPLNLIIRYSIKAYWLLYRWLKHSGWKDMLDDAYWHGYNDGNTTREQHYELLARILKGEERS